MAFITEHFVSILVGALVAAAFVLAVWKIISDKRKGKSGCGGGCVGCPIHDSCHSRK